MLRIAKAIEKCLFRSKWKPTEGALEELETKIAVRIGNPIGHPDYGQPELDADGFPAEEEKWSVDPLTGMWRAPREPVPEPDSVYFWHSGMRKPRSTFSAEWNLRLDEPNVDSWQCPYCNSLHSLTEYRCTNCGAVRTREY